MDELTCLRCETDEHLVGAADGELIRITCTKCGLAWERDPSPRCMICGHDEVRTVAEPVIEKARGTQLSIVGVTTTHYCHACYKSHYLTRDFRHIPPGQNPAS